MRVLRNYTEESNPSITSAPPPTGHRGGGCAYPAMLLFFRHLHPLYEKDYTRDRNESTA